MFDVVTYVQQNPNPQALSRYFSPNDQAYVTAIFDTVRQLAQPGGLPNPRTGIRLSDLSQVVVNRVGGFGAVLAETSEFGLTDQNPSIEVNDFAWGALYKRLKSDLNCDCDIKKVNYKLHFLGTLLLHETLYVTLIFPSIL